MKRRQGFVSNSSSSSFVLFGVSLDDDQVSALYIQEIDNRMITKYGSLEAVPTKGYEKYSDESKYWDIQDDAEFIDDECSYEKAEVAGVHYGDEYIGFMYGFHPLWFKENPTKTWNDAIAEHIAKMAEAGIKVTESDFNYIEEEVYS